MSRVKYVYAKVLAQLQDPSPLLLFDGGTGFCLSQLGIIDLIHMYHGT